MTGSQGARKILLCGFLPLRGGGVSPIPLSFFGKMKVVFCGLPREAVKIYLVYLVDVITFFVFAKFEFILIRIDAILSDIVSNFDCIPL